MTATPAGREGRARPTPAVSGQRIVTPGSSNTISATADAEDLDMGTEINLPSAGAWHSFKRGKKPSFELL